MVKKSDKSDTKSSFQEQERTTLMKAKFLETLAMDRVAGNVLVAANAIGLSRDTVYRWKNDDPQFAEKWSDTVILAGDKRADLAEDKLFELVLKGNITAIMYTLKKYRPERYDRNDSGEVIVGTPTHKMSSRFAKVYERLMANKNNPNTDSISV